MSKLLNNKTFLMDDYHLKFKNQIVVANFEIRGV